MTVVLSPGLRDRLAGISERYDELGRLMSDPAVVTDRTRMRQLGRERSQLEPIVATITQLRHAEAARDQARELVGSDDPEMRELAREELTAAETEVERISAGLRLQLVPRDPLDEKDVIMEIRSGEGGEEAALFALDLYRMYTRYAELKRWRTEMLSQSASEKGGFKEAIFRIAGKGAYSRLKFESGVHRVQRVPTTEAQGRIHTSTASVAVLPEAEDVDIEIDEARDLRIDVYRAGGKGGQGVNTTDSAVRITHIPTGIVVTCQDERSQLKNKAKAMAVLRARLLAAEQERRESEEGATRRAQIGRAERAEKMRTYNFPQDRITDKRLGYNLSNIAKILDGDLDELTGALMVKDESERLARLESGASAGVPDLEQVLTDRRQWDDKLELASLRPYMYETTLRRVERGVILDWWMAHGNDQVEPDPPNLGRVRELLEGGYAFRAPGGTHSRSHISVRWQTPTGNESDPGHVPLTWVRVRAM